MTTLLNNFETIGRYKPLADCYVPATVIKKRAPKRGKLLSDDIHSIVNRLTVEQIKFAFAKLGKTPEKGKRDKISLIETLLTSGTDLSEIQKIVFEIEAATAPKHLYVGLYSAPKGFRPPNRHRVFGSTICPNVKKLELVFWQETEEFFHLTFQHKITTVRWVQKDEVTRKKETEIILHAVFVRFDRKDTLFTVGYSGFENNAYKRDPNRVTYSEIVSDVLNVLNQEIGVTASSLPVKKAIDFLIQHNSTRLYREKGDPEFKFGKLTVQTKEGTKGIENVLVNIFANSKFKFNQQELAEAAKEALKNSSMQSVVALWTDEDLVSRIEFWDLGAEFLFIWRRTVQSYSKCYQIFRLIRETAKNLDSSSNQISLLLGFESGKVFKAADISSSTSIDSAALKKLIVDGINLGLIIPIYRIKTNTVIQEGPNDWTHDLPSLAKTFTLEDGNTIDGKDPKNVEIAFLRSAEIKQESENVAQ